MVTSYINVNTTGYGQALKPRGRWRAVIWELLPILSKMLHPCTAATNIFPPLSTSPAVVTSSDAAEIVKSDSHIFFKGMRFLKSQAQMPALINH